MNNGVMRKEVIKNWSPQKKIKKKPKEIIKCIKSEE